ncbi:MAG: hypothetical protein UY40_C0006G0014 [candidate division CPR1 bacterium GW2011_GWC1_49_13]|uniref:Uncharacterized protein n=1 Tax=candidate division CPR1 bacterium GW2011_GWC1_49_13 TaxID=1618342 RepID=A0A0G1VI48_9BACT|nr:MAG: hypothetical protein UY40_C0006G0014 [candidate division CPR1 bacterium GW2011_GWC1_49_13]
MRDWLVAVLVAVLLVGVGYAFWPYLPEAFVPYFGPSGFWGYLGLGVVIAVLIGFFIYLILLLIDRVR